MFMKSALKILFAIVLVVLIVGFIYFNVKEYKEDSYEEKETVAEEGKEQVNEIEVSVVYNVAGMNVTATEKIAQSTQNRTTGYIPQKDESKFNEIIESENVEVIEDNNEDENIIKNPELVSLEITEYRLEENRITLTITDNNEVPYSLNDRYKIEKLNNEEWEEVERINPEEVLLIAKKYNLDENNQYNFKINWTNSYGKLEDGTYRIVKEFEDDVFYSNEFEIRY